MVIQTIRIRIINIHLEKPLNFQQRTGSGFTLRTNTYPYTVYVEITDGSDELSYDSGRGTYKLGKNANFTDKVIAGVKVSVSGGTMTMTANTNGNSYSITDGYRYISSTTTGEITYTAYDAYNGNIEEIQPATDGNPAYYTMNLSSYTDVDSFAKALVGKSIRYNYDNYYEFIDTSDESSLNAIQRMENSKTIDLKEVKETVKNGNSIAEAFGTLLKNSGGSQFSLVNSAGENVDDESTADKTIAGIKITSNRSGTLGNGEPISAHEGTLRHYDIDYGSWFKKNKSKNIPDFLDGKGFRAYCATDAKQWFNFIFQTSYDPNRPKNGTDDMDIKSIVINVSSVKTAKDLVEAIYRDATPLLTGSDKNYNHHMRVAVDKEKGILTLYDDRKYKVDIPGEYDYQQMGAKISDGVLDNIVKTEKNLYVRDFVIQHTDKQNMNIHLKIPQMTLSNIFGMLPDYQRHSIQDYSVTSKSDRNFLLGDPKAKPPVEGILDKGLDYLLNANTLVGAQAALDYTENNVVTQLESTQNSESTARDADMAKEYTDYMKYNILSQASQSMLAQANQNMSGVLSLLR